ncbi:hypothetical protein Salat_2433700, partial [Sesamum alatum]
AHLPWALGLPLDSKVSKVLVDGQWQWLASRAVGLTEICGHLPRVEHGQEQGTLEEPWGLHNGGSDETIFTASRCDLLELTDARASKNTQNLFILWLAVQGKLFDYGPAMDAAVATRLRIVHHRPPRNPHSSLLWL